jgi:hypothetical protein
LRADILAAESQFQRFWRDMREGLHFLRDRRAVVICSASVGRYFSAP